MTHKFTPADLRRMRDRTCSRPIPLSSLEHYQIFGFASPRAPNLIEKDVFYYVATTPGNSMVACGKATLLEIDKWELDDTLHFMPKSICVHRVDTYRPDKVA